MDLVGPYAGWLYLFIFGLAYSPSIYMVTRAAKHSFKLALLFAVVGFLLVGPLGFLLKLALPANELPVTPTRS